MSGGQEPYIPAHESPLELTQRVIIVGVVLGVLMTAANAYLGLYAGMTVSASIPRCQELLDGSIKRWCHDEARVLLADHIPLHGQVGFRYSELAQVRQGRAGQLDHQDM